MGENVLNERLENHKERSFFCQTDSKLVMKFRYYAVSLRHWPSGFEPVPNFMVEHLRQFHVRLQTLKPNVNLFLDVYSMKAEQFIVNSVTKENCSIH